MGNKEFVQKSKSMILEYLEKTNQGSDVEIYCVWLCKVLKNSKGLFSANQDDGLYFEVTFNGDKDEFYLDAYKKESNEMVENW